MTQIHGFLHQILSLSNSLLSCQACCVGPWICLLWRLKHPIGICATHIGEGSSLDAMDVALWDAIILQLLHDALDDIIEARTKAAAGDDGCLTMPGVKEHLLPCSSPHGPGRQWHTDLQGGMPWVANALSAAACFLTRSDSLSTCAALGPAALFAFASATC